MRILFFSHYFPPEGNAPASRTYENCKRWVRDGHDVTIVTGVPNCPNGIVYDGYRNRVRQREIVDGIEVIRVWTYIAANKGTVRRIANYVSYMCSAILAGLFVRRPDIVIATSPQFFCGWAGLIVSRLRFLPFVLEIRDIWPESIQAVGAMKDGLLVRVLEWMEKRIYSSARRIVTVGEGYRERLVEKGVPPSKVSVITNGVDLDLFAAQEPDHALRRSLGLEGKFVCSYVGTIGMACGLDVVLRAARILKEEARDDICFLLVGDGAVRADLQAKARSQGLNNVVFTGRQEKEMMPAFLSISDACLVHLKNAPLFRTVMPSKVFEAGGMACPIIMGVEGFAADIVKRAAAGVFMRPENEADLVSALLELAAQPEKRRALGNSGRAYVVKHFNRDNLSRDYLAVIQDVAQEKKQT